MDDSFNILDLLNQTNSKEKPLVNEIKNESW